MIRSIVKLHASAKIRFPEDADARQKYIDRVLQASDRHDDRVYEITPDAFDRLKAEIVAEFGSRPRLRANLPAAEQGLVGVAGVFRRFASGRSAFARSGRVPFTGVVTPGRLLKRVIEWLTGEPPRATCSCKDRAKQMDRWGWRGCWRERRVIAGWLVGEAKKRGHAVAGPAWWVLGRAGVVESSGRVGRGLRRWVLPRCGVSGWFRVESKVQ